MSFLKNQYNSILWASISMRYLASYCYYYVLLYCPLHVTCHFYLWKIKTITYLHLIILLLRMELSCTLWSFEAVNSRCEHGSYCLGLQCPPEMLQLLVLCCVISMGLWGTWTILVSEMWTLSLLLGEWYIGYGRPGGTISAHCSCSWHWVDKVGTAARWSLCAICEHCQAGASTLGSEATPVY